MKGGALNWQQEMAKLTRSEDLFRRLSESRPMRRQQYADPATHVEFEAERARQAKVRAEKLKKLKTGVGKL